MIERKKVLALTFSLVIFLNCRTIYSASASASGSNIAQEISSSSTPNNCISRRSANTVTRTESMEDTNEEDEGEEEFVIGGGAINEKERTTQHRSAITPLTSTTYDSKSRNRANENDDKTEPSYNPEDNLSQLLHSLVGLDRYPNYLSRFDDVNDIDRLHCALQAKLRQVTEQRDRERQRRLGISELMRRVMAQEEDQEDPSSVDWSVLSPPLHWDTVREEILHPLAAEAIFQSKMFRNCNQNSSSDETKHRRRNHRHRQAPPTLANVLQGNVDVHLDVQRLETWLNQEMFDVYSFPLLKSDFTNKLRTAIRRIVSFAQKPEYAHLNLGKRPIDMDTIGVKWLNDLLLHLIIRPISRYLFAETERIADELDWRQGYVAGYSHDPSAVTGAQRHRLVSHTDDSEVTLNLSLGDIFEGGDLIFRGLRGTNEEGEMNGDEPFHPRLGVALLHAGRHLHEVTEVTDGDRYAYIVWARSWRGIRSQTCPCCWLNRRQENSEGSRSGGNHSKNNCICGPRWN